MDTTALLANTSKLFESIHVFQFKPSLLPQKDHFGSHVELLDFSFNSDHFIRRLRESIISWVFSKAKAKEIFEQEYGNEGDLSSASANLYHSAKETFRLMEPQGQFGELLLSGFLQHLFKAAPLLRKQLVRTSDNHERFGADAIHYSNSNGNNLYLGESKCYKSSYQFPAAFKASLDSMNTTLAGFSKEIRKFSVGGFIEEDLKEIAANILSNKLQGLQVNPVSIIIYNETRKRTGTCATECREEILNAISHQCAKIESNVYNSVEPAALNKITYIIMPVWNLDGLLNEFVEAL